MSSIGKRWTVETRRPKNIPQIECLIKNGHSVAEVARIIDKTIPATRTLINRHTVGLNRLRHDSK